MTTAFWNDHHPTKYGGYTIYTTDKYTVLLVKICCCSALHLMIFVEISQSMELMKYIVNHPEYFSDPGGAFLVAISAHTINLASEVVSLNLLMWY